MPKRAICSKISANKMRSGFQDTITKAIFGELWAVTERFYTGNEAVKMGVFKLSSSKGQLVDIIIFIPTITNVLGKSRNSVGMHKPARRI